MTECLVLPYRSYDDKHVNAFYALLSIYPNLRWVPPNLEIAAEAAQIRAEHRLRTPDALQAATALVSGVTAFLTNDPVFERIDGFETLVLDRLL